jgi:hypothetical protein
MRDWEAGTCAEAMRKTRAGQLVRLFFAVQFVSVTALW